MDFSNPVCELKNFWCSGSLSGIEVASYKLRMLRQQCSMSLNTLDPKFHVVVP